MRWATRAVWLVVSQGWRQETTRALTVEPDQVGDGQQLTTPSVRPAALILHPGLGVRRQRLDSQLSGHSR